MATAVSVSILFAGTAIICLYLICENRDLKHDVASLIAQVGLHARLLQPGDTHVTPPAPQVKESQPVRLRGVDYVPAPEAAAICDLRDPHLIPPEHLERLQSPDGLSVGGVWDDVDNFRRVLSVMVAHLNGHALERRARIRVGLGNFPGWERLGRTLPLDFQEWNFRFARDSE